MAACETCWGQAFFQARTRGGTQVEWYEKLLVENARAHTPIGEESHEQ